MALLIVLHYLIWVIIFWDVYSFQFSAYCLVPKSKPHILGFCYCGTSFTHTAFVSVTYWCVTNLPKTELLKTIIFLRSWFCRSALAAGLIHSSVVCSGWVRWLHFWRLSGCWLGTLTLVHTSHSLCFCHILPAWELGFFSMVRPKFRRNPAQWFKRTKGSAQGLLRSRLETGFLPLLLHPSGQSKSQADLFRVKLWG